MFSEALFPQSSAGEELRASESQAWDAEERPLALSMPHSLGLLWAGSLHIIPQCATFWKDSLFRKTLSVSGVVVFFTIKEN